MFSQVYHCGELAKYIISTGMEFMYFVEQTLIYIQNISRTLQSVIQEKDNGHPTYNYVLGIRIKTGLSRFTENI